MSQNSLLSVTDLRVHYGAIQAVKGVSFEVHSGEVVSFVGANGAGKTTILRALSALMPYSGRVLLQNEDIAAQKAHERVRLGMSHSPEGRGVFPQMTVLENLAMGAYTRTDKKAIAADLEHCFSLFPRLKERLSQAAGTLSGGEQQMVAISRALMAKPKLLMLDEPSLGLAPQIVAQIFEIIKKVNAEGVTVLLVEQNAQMALKISHRAYVLETGRVVMEGSGQDLLGNDEIRKSYLGI